MKSDLDVVQVLLNSGFTAREGGGYYIAVSTRHNFLIAEEMLARLETQEEKQDFLITVHHFVAHRVPGFKIVYQSSK